MCDTSNCILEEKIVACVWIHERFQTGKSMKQVLDDFQRRLRKKPSTKTKTLDKATQTFLKRECEG